MVEFTTDGAGGIISITADRLDDVIIPAKINGEKIISLHSDKSQCLSGLRSCKSFASKTCKPLIIDEFSLYGMVASKEIDLSNVNLSNLDLNAKIKIKCRELFLPDIVKLGNTFLDLNLKRFVV